MFLLCMLLNTATAQVCWQLILNQHLAKQFVFLPLISFVYLDVDLTDKELMQELLKSINR